MGLCHTPHKLLKKFNQNFTRNRANARFLIKVEAFFKKLVGTGEAHGFGLRKTAPYRVT